jgi:hypothetical protein
MGGCDLEREVVPLAKHHRLAILLWESTPRPAARNQTSQARTFEPRSLFTSMIFPPACTVSPA